MVSPSPSYPQSQYWSAFDGDADMDVDLGVGTVSLMTPALLFSKVAFSLTPSKLKEMWIIPLGSVFRPHRRIHPPILYFPY